MWDTVGARILYSFYKSLLGFEFSIFLTIKFHSNLTTSLAEPVSSVQVNKQIGSLLHVPGLILATTGDMSAVEDLFYF